MENEKLEFNNENYLEHWAKLLPLIQSTPDDTVVDIRVRIKNDDINISSLRKLVDVIDNTRRKYGKRPALITIRSKDDEINNIELTKDIPVTEDQEVEVIIDYVAGNVDNIQEEAFDKKSKELAEADQLKEIGSKLELDPNLPQELTDIKEWPKEIPDYNLLAPLFVFQLGNLPCYAKIGPDPKQDDFLEVQMIYVEPEYRNKGLGIQMLKLLRKKFPRLSMTPTTKEGLALTEKYYQELDKE